MKRQPHFPSAGPHVGVPFCSERCPKFDGKRCDELGYRPDNVCIPEVQAMANDRTIMRTALRVIQDAADVALGEPKS